MLTVLTGDALEQLRTLPDESVQCCVTSPPYLGLRDYGTAAWEGGDLDCDHEAAKIPIGNSPSNKSTLTTNNGRGPQVGDKFSAGSQFGYAAQCKCGARRIDSQLGLERTPEEYVAKMVAVFREVRRVLRKDGTMWLNLGDRYASDTKGQNNNGEGGSTLTSGARPHVRAAYDDGRGREGHRVEHGLKPKDLCGIPWRVAFALQADGWWLRSDIIWAKPNPMPESVTDRPTKSHEYLFLLTKASSYFYDAEAIREPHTTPIELQIERVKAAKRQKSARIQNSDLQTNALEKWSILKDDGDMINPAGRNKRSIWTVATAPYPEAHFATYPPDLIKPCIMAGTSAKGCCGKCGAPWERVVEQLEATGRTDYDNSPSPLMDGIRSGRCGERNSKTIGWQPTCKCDAAVTACTVLDPFAGSGTTGMVALELGRKAVLIELNPKYCDLIRQRCDVTPGLQLA